MIENGATESVTLSCNVMWCEPSGNKLQMPQLYDASSERDVGYGLNWPIMTKHKYKQTNKQTFNNVKQIQIEDNHSLVDQFL